MIKWTTIQNAGDSIALDEIVQVSYRDFYDDICNRLADINYHVAEYFAFEKEPGKLIVYCIVLNDKTHKVMVCSYSRSRNDSESFASLSAKYPCMHVFEREMAERWTLKFENMPWDKPLRMGVDTSSSCDYPFYEIEGDVLHQVNVGPIHAGIIEPGVFRFICNGEKVLHLETALGYQYRGVESLICSTNSCLRQILLAENIAGDSAVAHALAYTSAVEGLGAPVVRHSIENSQLAIERTIALEMERMAIHIADTGALCSDIGYQLGHVACEALRTIVINTMQLWCGNRFGKGLIRTCGSYYSLDYDTINRIIENITTVRERYEQVRVNLKNTPSVLSRFEECGILNRHHAQTMGLVGVVARASGLKRDIRESHPSKIYSSLHHKPIVREQGDVMARVMVRGREVLQSSDYIIELLGRIVPNNLLVENTPIYTLDLEPDSMSVSLVEGWRGEICHVAITDGTGKIAEYKIKDPSMHNWIGLAVAVRGEGISDFPICNKSFNLSYCGHDL